MASAYTSGRSNHFPKTKNARNGEDAGSVVTVSGKNSRYLLRGARRLGVAVAAGEFLDASGGINEFLFAGEKGMARRADTDLDVALGGTGVVNGPAGAGDRRFDVIGMDISFHSEKGNETITESLWCKRAF